MVDVIVLLVLAATAPCSVWCPCAIVAISDAASNATPETKDCKKLCVFR